jgi:hypothetical protein
VLNLIFVTERSVFIVLVPRRDCLPTGSLRSKYGNRFANLEIDSHATLSFRLLTYPVACVIATEADKVLMNYLASGGPLV